MIRLLALSATCLGLFASSAAADIPYYAQSPKNRSVRVGDCTLNATAPTEYQSVAKNGYYVWYADTSCSQSSVQATFCLQESVRHQAWRNLICGSELVKPGIEARNYDVVSQYSGPIPVRTRLRTRVFAGGVAVSSQPIRVPLNGTSTVAPS